MATGATHPATAYFCTQLHALAQTKRVRDLDTGRTRKITARTIHTLLIEACPTIAPSQTSWYRYWNGQLAPPLTLVVELAEIFGVPPSYFCDPPSLDDGQRLPHRIPHLNQDSPLTRKRPVQRKTRHITSKAMNYDQIVDTARHLLGSIQHHVKLALPSLNRRIWNRTVTHASILPRPSVCSALRNPPQSREPVTNDHRCVSCQPF